MTLGSPSCLAGAERNVQKPCSCPGPMASQGICWGATDPDWRLPLCALTSPRPVVPGLSVLDFQNLYCQNLGFCFPLLFPSPAQLLLFPRTSPPPTPNPHLQTNSVSWKQKILVEGKVCRSKCPGWFPPQPGWASSVQDTEKGQADFQLVCPREVT